MDMNGATPLDGYLRVAQDQQRKEQEMLAGLQAAMQAPHTIETVTAAAFGGRTQDSQKVLMVATPDGKRRDFVLNGAVINQIRQLLDMPEEELAA